MSSAAAVMRCATVLMAVVFAGFAAVQYNDPDAALWVGLYGLAAVASALAASGRRTPLPALALVAHVVGFLVLAPAIDAGWYHNEEAREALGLAIAASWMVALLVGRP